MCVTELMSEWNMHRSSHLSVQGACCLDIGFRHMFSALDCVPFGWCIRHVVRSSPCVLLIQHRSRDTCRWGILPITWLTSPGVGFALVGTYLQSKMHLFFYPWQSNERLNRHIGFNVIFAAVYYDVLLVFHDVNILLVYM